MIRALSLQNFQSHKYTELEFDPGVNVIVGESDMGKTAVIRALRWVVWNRPTGEAFRSSWGGNTQVAVQVGDDVISRQRTDSDNSYHVSRGNGRLMIFETVGTDVPDEITELLNVNEINLQQQLDSPFLLSDSPGSVAEFFNRIARLDKIDSGLQNVNREIRELTECIKYDQAALDKHVTELTQYDHLDKFEADVEVLEGMETQFKSRVVDIATLTNLLKRIELNKREIERVGEVLKHEPQVSDLLDRISRREGVQENCDDLYKLITDYKTIELQIEDCTNTLLWEETTNETLKLIEKRDAMKMKQESMRRLVKNVLAELQQLQQAEKECELLHKRFDKEFPDVCPLCNQPVKK